MNISLPAFDHEDVIPFVLTSSHLGWSWCSAPTQKRPPRTRESDFLASSSPDYHLLAPESASLPRKSSKAVERQHEPCLALSSENSPANSSNLLVELRQRLLLAELLARDVPDVDRSGRLQFAILASFPFVRRRIALALICIFPLSTPRIPGCAFLFVRRHRDSQQYGSQFAVEVARSS